MKKLLFCILPLYALSLHFELAAQAESSKPLQQSLLEKPSRRLGASCERIDAKLIEDFVTAAGEGELTVVKDLLGKKINPNCPDSLGYSALIMASFAGYYETTQFLLDRGALVSQGDRFGYRPIMAAAFTGKQALLELLLDNGADINVQDDFGFSALMAAASNGFHTVMLYLLQNGADLGLRNNQGQTALHLAAENGKKQSVQLLLDNAAVLDDKDTNGQTPLIRAVLGDQLEVVQLLLSRGAKATVQDDVGWSVFHYAHDKPQILQALRDARKQAVAAKRNNK